MKYVGMYFKDYLTFKCMDVEGVGEFLCSDIKNISYTFRSLSYSSMTLLMVMSHCLRNIRPDSFASVQHLSSQMPLFLIARV